MKKSSGPYTMKPGCSCGAHASQLEHERACTVISDSAADDAKLYGRTVEQAVLRAIVPNPLHRRALLQSVGASTLASAIASFFPLATATEAFAQAGKPEKSDLKVGFIPISCATPIIMAEPMGFYKKQGLNVEVVKTAGWAVIRDKTINKEYDAAHMLAAMPSPFRWALAPRPFPSPCPPSRTSTARRSRWP